jgi:predicted DNA-binding protein
MKKENKTPEKHQFSMVMNNAIRNQLKYLAAKQQKTEAKFIKDLVNRYYMDEVVKEQ